jgi:hypothetical protein
MVVTMKDTIFWVVMLCISEKAQHFRGIYSIHRMNQAKNQYYSFTLMVCCLASSLTLNMEMIGSSKTCVYSKLHHITTQKAILSVYISLYCIVMIVNVLSCNREVLQLNK